MDLTEILGPTKKPKGKWSKYVPIIKKDNITDIYLTEEIADAAEYNEACHTIRNAVAGDIINLHLNNGGGMLDSAFYLVNAIKDSPATITAHLSGTVASASTIIALACKNVVPQPYCTFMIHNYSMGSGYSKGHELKQRQTYMDKHNVDTFNEFYRGFLTDEEITLMIEGRDYWMNAAEVSRRLVDRDAAIKG